MFLLKLGILAYLCWVPCYGITIFPDGNQWEYNYEGKVNAGTHIPIPGETGWTLHAKLVVTSSSNTVIMQLTDVRSTYYNGVNEEEKGKNDEIPKEAKHIEEPFIAQYNEGDVEGIIVSKEDPTWSVNIKRAIAGVFQLNLKKLKDVPTYIDERNIYGHCKNIEYSVTNTTSGDLEITKVINFDSCQKSDMTFKTTTDFFCKPESVITASAGRRYIVNFEIIEGGATIKELGSIAERLVQPFNARYGAYRLFSKQVIKLKQTVKVKDAVAIPATLTAKKDLTFEQTFDFTQDRTKFDQNEAIRIVKEQAGDVADSLEDKITQNPVALHNNTINTIYWIMFNLDEAHFDKLYADIAIGTSYLDETRKNLVLEILPQIGSHASVNFIKKLVLNRKLNNLSALKILAQYPFYMKQMSEKLLTELEVFLDLNPNFDENIKNTAVLSFATMVYKTYSSGMCSTETFEKYVLKYFTLFTDSTTHERRMVYLHGLRNLQLGSVVDFLTPVVKNKSNSHHIRFLAVWAFMANAHTKPTQMYNLYWPIFTDRTEHVEMRVAALTMLIISQPTSSRLMSLYWYMKTEPSAQLNNFFYSTLNSLQYTTYPCYLHLGKIAAKIVRYVTPPTKLYKRFTENVILDYINSEGDFGSMYQLFLVGNDNEYVPNIMYLTMSKFGSGQTLQQVAIYLKLVGVKDSIKGKWDHSLKETYVDILKKQNLKLYTPEPFHFEFLLQIQDKTVFCKYFDSKTIKEVTKILGLLDDSHFNHQFTIPPTTMDYFGTSDFGTSAYVGFMRNSLSSLRSNFTSTNDKEKLVINTAHDLHFRYMEYFEKRLDIFNPIRNIYHGLVKLKTMQTDLSYNTTLDAKFREQIFTNKWDLSKGKGGITVHGQTMTYLASMEDLLYNQHSSLFSVKTINPPNCKKQDKLIEYPVKSLGIKFVFTVFDCSNFDNYKKLLTHSFADLVKFQHNTKNDKYYLKLVLYFTHLLDKINYYAPTESCGISLHILPYYEGSSVMEIQGFYAESIHVEGRLFKENDPTELYQWWNASVVVENKLSERNTYIKFNCGNSDGKSKALCLKYKLDIPRKEVNNIELEMTSLRPLEKSLLEWDLSWGAVESNNQCSGVPSINYKIISSVSKEQINAAKSSTIWPFKQCKEYLGSRTLNIAHPACLLSVQEMCTYRNYDHEIEFKQVSDLVTKGIDKMYEILQFQNDKIATPTFDKGNAKVKFNILFPMQEPKIIFTSSNNEKAVIDYAVNSKLLRYPKTVKFDEDFFEDYGTCIISSDVIRTQKNVTLTNLDNANKYIALTQCLEWPEYVIIVGFEKEGIYVNIKNPWGLVEILPKTSGVEVLVGGNAWNEIEPDLHIQIEHKEDFYRIKYPENMLAVAYRKNYVILESDTFHSCGICNPESEELDKYIIEKTV